MRLGLRHARVNAGRALEVCVVRDQKRNALALHHGDNRRVVDQQPKLFAALAAGVKVAMRERQDMGAGCPPASDSSGECVQINVSQRQHRIGKRLVQVRDRRIRKQTRQPFHRSERFSRAC